MNQVGFRVVQQATADKRNGCQPEANRLEEQWN